MVNLSTTQEARIYNGEKTASSINGVMKIGQLHARETKWTNFYAIYKNKLKQIKHLNFRSETIPPRRKHRQYAL